MRLLQLEKKNKKKVVIQDPADDSVDKLAEKTETLAVSDGLDFSNLKKEETSTDQLPACVLFCMVHVAPARMQTRHVPSCQAERPPVAHIVEHPAFSAIKIYTNHDIVNFLESIGAEFGACQNAMVSADETVYELFDKPELLSQAISVRAEFSFEIRVF